MLCYKLISVSDLYSIVFGGFSTGITESQSGSGGTGSYRGLTLSVADPGCLSWIPDTEFYPSRIPDPKTATKERGGKKFVSNLFGATN
jgi:hypothetical protein